MSIRVLVVDDSSFIRTRLAEILAGDTAIEVVGSADNGLDAVRLAEELRPDVITMDIDMPVLDGITATRRIMRQRPVPILMFSVATQTGARATLDALEAGAMDFLPKQLHEISADRETAKSLLRRRVRDLAAHSPLMRKGVAPARSGGADKTPSRKRRAPSHDYDLILVAASTGGPIAVQQVLARLPANLKSPVLVVQHMPGNFTGGFAERLDQLCRVSVKQAEHGDALRPGVVLLAPGGYQMELTGHGKQCAIALRDGSPGEILKPCADITFGSVASKFSGRILAVVLTGMGSDGCKGATALKSRGAEIWAQDEASCVVFGMPRAVIAGNLADQVFSLDEIAEEFARLSAWTS